MAKKDAQSREETVREENAAAAEEAEKNLSNEDKEERNNDAHPSLDNMPEGQAYVGLLEYEVNPDHVDESFKQQAENYPRPLETDFDPANHEPEEARPGRASTSRAVVGRVVVVEHDLIHDGEVYKAGVQDLPLEVADALIGDGQAWEPAGKKRGR